jgi:hypothetical protein
MSETNPVNNPPKVKTIAVQLALQGQIAGQEPPTARAYLFNRAGKLVASRLLQQGDAIFEAPADQQYRVTVGPDLLAASRPAPASLLAQLAQAKAISQDISAGDTSVAFNVNPNIWNCWILRCINVQGTVTKSSGNGTTVPICIGTVKIFEIDFPCILDRVPLPDLANLKFEIVSRLNASVAVSQAPAGKASLRRQTVNIAPSPSRQEMASTIASLDGAALQNFLVLNKEILGPIWCELIRLPWLCWREVAEVPIQSDGSFNAEVCFSCPDLFPDLYFEVYQNVDGNEIELTSQTDILCGVYWSYDGSQSVDITVTDPRAIGCLSTGTGPGYLYVWPTAIGNQDLSLIDGLETGTGTGLLPGVTPFGGLLSMQMNFDPSLQANNIQYYRWSYMFAGDSGFTQINTPVTHRYMTVAPGPPIVITLNSVTLGPQTVGSANNLFAIPDPSLSWVDIDDPADRPFAYFDSTTGVTPGRSGMVTMMLEMFDGAGNFVPCNNPRGTSTAGDLLGDPSTGAFTYILPEIGGAPGTYTNAPKPNITDHGRLIFQILVDNNPTQAGLPAVSTPEGSADSCGMLHYGAASDTVALDYYAYHPNNYLDWDLTITRGLSGTVASIPPSPPPTDTSSGSEGSPAVFDNSAGTLLGSCPQAAFAVNLYCAARATNGYSRQTQYDSSATIAFALTTP